MNTLAYSDESDGNGTKVHFIRVYTFVLVLNL